MSLMKEMYYNPNGPFHGTIHRGHGVSDVGVFEGIVGPLREFGSSAASNSTRLLAVSCRVPM